MNSIRNSFLILFWGCFALLISCKPNSHNSSVRITVDRQTVEMGKSIKVNASIRPDHPDKKMMMLPYVNGKRWGSHEFANQKGEAQFIIPLPNQGPAVVEVVAVPSDRDDWMGVTDYSLLKTGSIMPAELQKSNAVMVEVAGREISQKDNSESLFGMQWEPWFTPGRQWTTSQAVPLLGLYDSTDPDVTRQHILWFTDLGVDFIIPDWSNHIWGCKHWSERGAGTNLILHCTQMFLEVLADMRDEGLPVPKVALMPGLSNGPPAKMVALNEELQWIYQNYVLNPRFEGLWQIYEDKPLIIILDTGVIGNKSGRTKSTYKIPFFRMTMAASEQDIDQFRQKQGVVDETHFTVRLISSQNQTTHHHELGYWSWMDGSLSPKVTYRNHVAEATTVTPALFAKYGWATPEAYGRRNGWTYLQSFKTAMKNRPRVIMLHQFNEFTGQAIGQGYGPDKNIYLDSYSMELSDDLEPVSITAPGYRDKKGGWGFYYLNMTHALMDLYRNNASDITIMAGYIAEQNDENLSLEWTTVGKAPSSFTILVDGKEMANITATKHDLSLKDYRQGEHIIAVRANNVSTRYSLSETELDVRSDKLMPVQIQKEFRVDK